MTDFKFDSLNDKEFENFATDLLTEDWRKKIVRFRPGKDGGVDGRYYVYDVAKKKQLEVVIQCKHWVRTSIDALIDHLQNVELPKVRKLNPKDYFIVTSKDLNRTEITKIYMIFKEYMSSPDNVIGMRSLNDTLAKHQNVLQRHYKIWYGGTEVLRNILNQDLYLRSEGKWLGIQERFKFYHPTANHKKALDILLNSRSIIIVGAPGSGKTTLAEQLCYELVADGHEFCAIENDISDGLKMWRNDTKQVFYFDDFLGRNYLDAIDHKMDSAVIEFIARIAQSKSSKMFILTSRNNILNQAEDRSEILSNKKLKSKYELFIDDLSYEDKAHIFYNHLWHGKLKSEYEDQLYIEKRYRQVVKHPNYNPRLISLFIDQAELNASDAEGYWRWIVDTMNNPSEVWSTLFNYQLDEYGRLLVTLTVLNGASTSEDTLHLAFNRYCDSNSIKAHNQANHDFNTVTKHLLGSMIKRTIAKDSPATIDVFNPSVGDFIIRALGKKHNLQRYYIALRTPASIRNLIRIFGSNLIDENTYNKIVNELTDFIGRADKNELSFYFIVCVGRISISSMEKVKIQKYIDIFCDKFEFLSYNESDLLELFAAILNRVRNKDILNLLQKYLSDRLAFFDHTDLNLAVQLSKEFDADYHAEVVEKSRTLVMEHWKEEIHIHIKEDLKFHEEDLYSYSTMRSQIKEEVRHYLKQYDFDFNQEDIDEIAECVSLEDVVEYQLSQRRPRSLQLNSMNLARLERTVIKKALDEDLRIDDIFERD